jgi:hypothetical protein
MSQFPVAFRPPASASRSSQSRQGIGSPHGRPTSPKAGPRRGYRVPHARAATGAGAPYTPRTVVLVPAGSPPRPAPAASQRPVPKPRHSIPPCEAPLHEASTGVHSRSPVRSSPRPRPRDGTAAFRLSPELRTPPLPATHVRGRDRPSSTDLELPLNSHPSISNPVVHSMRATSRRTARRRCVATGRLSPAFSCARASAGGTLRDCLCPRAATSPYLSVWLRRLLRAENGCASSSVGQPAQCCWFVSAEATRLM